MARLFALVTCLCASALVLYSCSMHAAVRTDDNGQIVAVSSLRLESSLSRLAVAMLVVSGELGLELRWLQRPGPAASSQGV